MPAVAPRFVPIPRPRADRIRALCLGVGVPMVLACLAIGALLVVFAVHDGDALPAWLFGGFSAFAFSLAAISLTGSRSTVPGDHLDLVGARSMRRLPWAMWLLTVPFSFLGLAFLGLSSSGGWALAGQALVIVGPSPLALATAVVCVNLFRVPSGHEQRAQPPPPTRPGWG
ncbi:hypothetical protein [Umezawaea sp. Da 62-37]|uniref:hypothetical protein n=1 Tax=Umezawaea sp. Da 62-37 TaxID=3075927 RepID=UPI0028F73784|nr:hypothetical protein [Umezawaea sp. Da 62-37]WNV82074.1 hypothetical protein RM788_28100 [Umezawaea sp. Da 62-37]